MQISNMAFQIIFLAVLVFGVASCKSQNTLPLTYSSRQLRGTNVSCAPEELRQATQQAIRNDVRTLIGDSVIPLLSPTSIQQCPCLTGGGRRVAYLNMTDPNHQCPTAWREIIFPRRTCGRRTTFPSCDSAFFPANGRYSRVCGRVRGYQYCSPNGFEGYADDNAGLDSFYVEGVSITHGSAPRTHIWTFAAAYSEAYTGSNQWICPCTNINNLNTFVVPPFIGEDYFCETGATTDASGCDINTGAQFFTDDPLWDGNGCISTDSCCDRSDPSPIASYFCKTLPGPTTDAIEVRICANQGNDNEDTPIELIEIYVS